MSGHSKWSTIKRKKGAIDSERSKVFQKIAKELYVAAKSGDPNPENNPSLRMVVEKAKAENMPKTNIESAINKAKNQGVGENYEHIRYEGYGPGGIAIMIDCLTDNKNRTAGFVRSTLTKRGGNLGAFLGSLIASSSVAAFAFSKATTLRTSLSRKVRTL